MISIEYIAGLFDGEGSTGIYRCHGERFLLRTQLTQNCYQESRRLLKHLCKLYGGNMSPQRSLSGKKKFNWQLNSHRALEFLKDILPFLVLKREQAKVAVQWQTHRPRPTRNPNTGHFFKYPNTRKDAAVAACLKRLKRKQ